MYKLQGDSKQGRQVALPPLFHTFSESDPVRLVEVSAVFFAPVPPPLDLPKRRSIRLPVKRVETDLRLSRILREISENLIRLNGPGSSHPARISRKNNGFLLKKAFGKDLAVILTL